MDYSITVHTALRVAALFAQPPSWAGSGCRAAALTGDRGLAPLDGDPGDPGTPSPGHFIDAREPFVSAGIRPWIFSALGVLALCLLMTDSMRAPETCRSSALVFLKRG